MLISFGNVGCAVAIECCLNAEQWGSTVWIDIHLAANQERAAEFIETYLASGNAPKASDYAMRSLISIGHLELLAQM